MWKIFFGTNEIFGTIATTFLSQSKISGIEKANYKFNTLWDTEKNLLTVLDEPGKNVGGDT